jgi:hypothetical protein
MQTFAQSIVEAYPKLVANPLRILTDYRKRISQATMLKLAEPSSVPVVSKSSSLKE